MKTFIKYGAVIMIATLCAVSCANAGARKEKKQNIPEEKAVTELTQETFKSKVFDMTQDTPVFIGDKPTIVDFTATWCGPCRALAPILEELAVEYKGKVNVYKIDVDNASEIAKAFNISAIPAVLFIPADGEPVMKVGLRKKEEMKKDIDNLLLGK